MTEHVLTVDLEDWHQLLHRKVTGRLSHPSCRVERQTHSLLDLLDECKVHATFFVLGCVAEVYPDLVRELARRGHEVGSHSYSHQLIYQMEAESFADDVRRSRYLLQDLTGQPILGFRAPEFSVPGPDHWCFRVLAEAGFAYDSSVFPVRQVRYGIPGAPRVPFIVTTEGGPIREFPLATWDLAGQRIPIAGGTYFRFLPAYLLRLALADLDRFGRTAVLYVHPYEFHEGWLLLSGLSWKERVHRAHIQYGIMHNIGTPLIRSRLRSLLTSFKFVPLETRHVELARAGAQGAQQ